MIIIGIAGGTGSGKTTVVRKIIESLPPGSVAVIPQDSYYNDQSSIPLEIRKQTNFDHPDAFDWPLFEQQIADLRKGHPIEQPNLFLSSMHTPARNSSCRAKGSHHCGRYHESL